MGGDPQLAREALAQDHGGIADRGSGLGAPGVQLHVEEAFSDQCGIHDTGVSESAESVVLQVRG
jgi:hypothetical protein